MNIDTNRQGEVIYNFDDDVYIQKENGELTQLSH